VRFLHELRWVILALALVPSGYFLAAIIAALRFFSSRHRALPRDFAPPVSLLKPVRGLDRDAYENYASFCRLDYPEYEILFNVADEHDAAIPVLEKLIRDFPERSIRLFVGAEQLGSSNKVNKLSNMVSEARHNLLVISDSDIRVTPDYLRAVVAPFRDPRVGAVTCLYRGVDGQSLGSTLEALGNTADFAAGVLVAWLFRSVNFALGATMATSKQRITEIGGFEDLADHFTDDHELGHRIAALGYRVEIAARPVDTVYPETSIREFFRHQLRWSLAIRHATPAGYVSRIFVHAIAWTLLAMAVAPSLKIAAIYLAAYVTLRPLMAWTVGVWGLRDPLLREKFWLLPVHDACAFVVYMVSYLTRRVEWRGTQYYIRGKELIPVSHDTARASARG
jgi:ceramide glucosyltransferase